MNVLFPIVALHVGLPRGRRSCSRRRWARCSPGKPADGKLVPGDRIVSIDGDPGRELPGVAAARRARAPASRCSFGVERDGKTLESTVTPLSEARVIEPRELDIVEHVGQIGFALGASRRRSSACRGPTRPPYRAGLRTFDRVTAINGRKVERLVDLVDALAANRGDTVVVSVPAPGRRPASAIGGLCDLAVLEPGRSRRSRPRPGPPGGRRARRRERAQPDVLARTGIESADLYVAFVPESVERVEGRPARRRSHHVARRRSAAPLAHRWRTSSSRGADRMHELTWTRDGEPMARPVPAAQGAVGRRVRPALRALRLPHRPLAAQRAATRSSRTRSPLALRARARARGDGERHQVHRRRHRCASSQGRVSLSSVSGPITIYDIAGQAGAKGTRVLRLGDGAHLDQPRAHQPAAHPGARRRPPVLLPLRGGSRKPLPLRVREVASLVGMIVLVVLMLVAFKNDVERLVGRHRLAGARALSRARRARPARASSRACRVGRRLRRGGARGGARRAPRSSTRATARSRRSSSTAPPRPAVARGADRPPRAPRDELASTSGRDRARAGGVPALLSARPRLRRRERGGRRDSAGEGAATSRLRERRAPQAGEGRVRVRGGTRAGDAVRPRVEARRAVAPRRARADARAKGRPGVPCDRASSAPARPARRARRGARRLARAGSRGRAGRDLRARPGLAARHPGPRRRQAAALPGGAEGAWSVQEEGSQLVALAVGAREGEAVLDACAGRGNKSALLARSGHASMWPT